ncbi:MAG: DUF86 domain-containing protein [Anaerolineales bacterium]
MNDEKRLKDILDAIDRIEIYAVEDKETFWKDEKTQDAILYNLLIIGEAVGKISKEFREKHPDVPWSAIIGTRNILAHGYDHVKLDIVWEILHNDLEPLKAEILRSMEQ